MKEFSFLTQIFEILKNSQFKVTTHLYLLLLFLFMVLKLQNAFAFLMISKKTQDLQLVSADILLVYDPLSNLQTTIYSADFQSSSGELLLLFPSPKSSKVFKVGEQIWKKLKQKTRHAKNIQRKLQIDLRSWLLERWSYQTSVLIKEENQLQMSGDLEFIIENERDLHHLLMDQGFSLEDSQIKAIKDIFKEEMWLYGMVIQQKKDTQKQIQSFRMPTVGITYLSQAPTLLIKTSLWLFHQRDIPIRLWVLNEASVQLNDHIKPKQIKSLSPVEVASLNQALGANDWSYKRTGILSHFELFIAQNTLLTLPFHGILNISQLDQGLGELDQEKHIEIHQLKIYIELVLLALLFLLWLWFDYANEDDRFFR